MKRSRFIAAFILSTAFSAVTAYSVPDSAEDICPILIGNPLPKITLKQPNGSKFSLNKAVAEKPTLIIFFRGGWCPYCNVHLQELQKIEPAIIKAGWQIIAISADKPEIVTMPGAEGKLNYRLLSDNDMEAAAALGIAFRVDHSLVQKYKTEYKIDIERDSGRTHHILPAPAAFLVDAKGIIQFSYVNPNYKIRLSPAVILEAIKTINSH